MFVVENGVVIRIHANSVAEHLLLVVEEAVCAEIVGEIHALIHGRAAVDGSGALSGEAVT